MIDIEKARALVETLKDYAEHPSSFTDISPTEADATADLIAALLDERDALARDAARFDWYFGKTDKIDFMQTYLTGMKDGWTPAQWRAAIDAAMKGASDES